MAENEAHAERLRALNEVWERLSSLTRDAGLGHRDAESSARGRRLREAYGLPPTTSPDELRPTEDLLDRIAAREPLGPRYSIETEIGRGGMGVVYRVQDSSLRRALAMKVMLARRESGEVASDAATRSLLARFLEEAQVTGQLDHPGIVPVHDLGVDDEGRVCFTMRLVRGEDLKRVFEHVFAGEDGWSETRALSVILKVCEAMAFAHQKGVIHRDLKPSNVMVGKFGEVYVMDWGLARVVGKTDPHDIRLRPEATSTLTSVKTERREEREDETDSPLITMDGQVVGTPAYMSPEQAQGLSDEVGPRADVYSVGAILWHLLARQVPYMQPGVRMTMRTVHTMVLQGPPAPLMKVRKDVPAELVAICEKAMSREPGRRYADMSELAEELRAYLEQRVVKAYSTGPVAELRKWVQRNKPLAAAIIVGVGVAIGALVAVSLVQADRKRDAQAHARESEKQAVALRQRNAELAAFTGKERLDRLIADRVKLPFAEAGDVPALESWLTRAQELIAGGGDGIGLGAWSDTLAALQPPTLEVGVAIDPELQRRAQEFEELLAAQEAALSVKQTLLRNRFHGAGSPTDPEEDVGIDWSRLPRDADDLNRIAWGLVDPDLPAGTRVRLEAVALARRALELAQPAERARILDTLAWALFQVGHDDDADVASAEAIVYAEGEPSLIELLTQSRARLLQSIKVASPPEKADQRTAQFKLEEEIRTLTLATEDLKFKVRAARSLPDVPTFERYLRFQTLQNLVARIQRFADPRVGLVAGTESESGYSFERRIAFARSVKERTVTGPEASVLWSAALEAIRNRSVCPAYDGLVMEAQVGLVPLGPDPASKLWEFAVLATGTLPARGAEGRIVLDESSALVLVLLPGARFHLGAQSTDPSGSNYDLDARPEENPVTLVDLEPFFVAKHEMTQAQWRRLSGVNPSNAHGGRTVGGKLLTLMHPVETIDWNESRNVLALVGLELPTEAQWEYAARGGTSTPWCCGESADSIEACGNVADRSLMTLGAGQDAAGWDDGWAVHCPVTAFNPNPFGLHGVIGNVWEWCRDLQGEYRDAASGPGAERHPFASSKRVLRGGGWATGATEARSARREADDPAYKAPTLGVRPVHAVKGQIQRAAGG